MAERKPARRGAGAGIGELQLLTGPSSRAQRAPESEVEETITSAARQPEPAMHPAPRNGENAVPAASLLRAEVYLPEEIVTGVRTQLRPQRTGHARTLSVPLLLQAYIRAVAQLGLDIDVRGLAPGDVEEAVARVSAALERWKTF